MQERLPFWRNMLRSMAHRNNPPSFLAGIVKDDRPTSVSVITDKLDDPSMKIIPVWFAQTLMHDGVVCRIVLLEIDDQEYGGVVDMDRRQDPADLVHQDNPALIKLFELT